VVPMLLANVALLTGIGWGYLNALTPLHHGDRLGEAANEDRRRSLPSAVEVNARPEQRRTTRVTDYQTETETQRAVRPGVGGGGASSDTYDWDSYDWDADTWEEDDSSDAESGQRSPASAATSVSLGKQTQAVGLGAANPPGVGGTLLARGSGLNSTAAAQEGEEGPAVLQNDTARAAPAEEAAGPPAETSPPVQTVAPQKEAEYERRDPEYHAINFRQYGIFFGIGMFTFEGIGLLLPTRRAMAQPEKMPQVVSSAMVFLTALFVTFGLACYLRWGGTPQDDDDRRRVLSDLFFSRRLEEATERRRRMSWAWHR